jgi:hypothetical protein
MSNSSSFVFNVTASIEAQLGYGVKDTGICSLNPQLWFVYPINGDTSGCSPASSILRTFGLVNLAVAILSLFLGHRAVTNRLTCGKFGGKHKIQWGKDKFGIAVPKSILYMWLLPIALQLGANAICATMMNSTTNYTQGFSIIQVTILYLVRPRITWLLGIIMIKFCPEATRKSSSSSLSVHLQTIGSPELSSDLESSILPVPVPMHSVGTSKPETVVTTDDETNTSSGSAFNFRLEEWQAWAYQQVIAEFMLQLVTAIIGTTVGNCESSAVASLVSGYETQLGFPIMYVSFIVICSVITLLQFNERRRGEPNKNKKRGFLVVLGNHLPFLFTLLFAGLLWAERWQFWVEYLYDSKDFG